MTHLPERLGRHSSILYDLYDIHNSTRQLHHRDESLTDSEINRDLKCTLKALETKSLSERDAQRIRKQKAKQTRMLLLKLATAVLACSSLMIPSMCYMAQMDTNRRSLLKTVENLNDLRKLADAVNSIGEELEKTLVVTTSHDWQKLEEERKQTDTYVENLNNDFKHSIFSFGTLLKTKSRLQLALKQIRHKIERKRNKMSMTIHEYSILMTLLTNNLITSINDMSLIENLSSLVKFKMSQIATTNLQVISSYWTASCRNETCWEKTCKDATKGFHENIVSCINVFIGVAESVFVQDYFWLSTKNDIDFLLLIRHVASHFVSNDVLRGDIDSVSELCSKSTDKRLLRALVKGSISSFESVLSDTVVRCNVLSETLGMYICALLFSLGLFVLASFIYYCQLKRVRELRNIECVLDSKVTKQRYELETILSVLVPSMLSKRMIYVEDSSNKTAAITGNNKLKNKQKSTDSSSNRCGWSRFQTNELQDICHQSKGSSNLWSIFRADKRKQSVYETMDLFVNEIPNQLMAEFIENVTLFKCDFIMLQELVRTFSPSELVNILTCLIGILEQRTNLYDVFVLGRDIDSYTVVSGVTPQQKNSHAEIIANMALDILNSCSDLEINATHDSKLRMRIGIHTGSCFVSLTHFPKPRYRLHGDITENTHHLQKTSLANRIQISETTGHFLRKGAMYEVQKRGFTNLPNGCTIETQWLLGRRVSVCVPNSDFASVMFPTPLKLEQKPVYHFDNEEMKYVPSRGWITEMQTYSPVRNAAFNTGPRQMSVFHENESENSEESNTSYSEVDV